MVIKLLSVGMLAACLCAVSTDLHAQRRRGGGSVSPALSPNDSSKPRPAVLPVPRADLPRPYKEVITAKAVSSKGFFTVHKLDDKYFLEIPDSLVGRELLVLNRIAGAPADFRAGRNPIGYAGEVIGRQLFHFSKGDNNRLLVQVKSYKERAVDSSANGLALLLERNNRESILNSFPIKAVNDSTHSVVIEITELLGQDNFLFGFGAGVKTAAGLGALVADRSYIETVKANADNIAFSFLRTYTKGGVNGGPVNPFTFELRTGMMLLPARPMKGRLADKRTAFQEISYLDFDSNPIGVENKGYICRWRLEPADAAAYAAGRGSKPLQPIRLYIDASMPAVWRPYVKAGIESWNRAFQKAGFLDAIEAVLPAEKDATSYLDAINRSAVVFMPGNGDNHGQLVTDPRTGEILQVQLNFYLSTLDKLYTQYFIQAGALDKAANRPVFTDTLMGHLVQAYTMQLMGNLLGLQKNTAASSANSITQLRNSQWLQSNAFNGSATDPVLVNYVVQPEDKVAPAQLLPKVSALDEWMINWGYRLIPGNEAAALDKWILEHTGPELYIGETMPGLPVADPRNLSGDLSNDAVQAARLGINNLKKVVPRLLDWTSEPATDNQRAGELYEALLDQYAAYVRTIIPELGGIYTNIRNSGQAGKVFSFVPLARQQRAMQFLQEQVFNTPSWLISKPLYARTSQRFDSVLILQRSLLQEVLSAPVLNRLQLVVQQEPAQAYTPMQFLADLSNGIFAELKQGKAIHLPRRDLQKAYILRLVSLKSLLAGADNDLPAVLNAHVNTLLKQFKQQQSLYTGIEKAHLSMLYERLYMGWYNPPAPAPANPFLRRL